jgi:MFS family permease
MAALQTAPSAFSIFQNRNFSLMWLGQLISEFGSGITSIAASILVYNLTGSAMSVGLMLMATALPGLVFGLIAGVVADRYDRKRILIISELIRAALIVLIPVLLPHSIIWLYVIVMLSSTISQFYNPAHASILPDIASESELGAANSMLSISSTGALGLGFAAAGFITSQSDVNIAFYIDAATFVISALLIFFVNVPPIGQSDESSVNNVLESLREGGNFLFNSPILRSLLIITVPMGILFGLHNSLMLPFADRALQASEFEYSLIEGVGLIGFVIGGLIMAQISDRLREGQWIVISLVIMGLAVVAFSQVTSVTFAILLSVVTLFFNVPIFIARQLIVQRNTTREIRGRVGSVFFMIRDVTFMIGMGMAGLADIFDIRTLIMLEGGLLAVGGLVALILPGMGRSAAEWKRALQLIRSAANAVELEAGHPVMLEDLNKYVKQIPMFAELSLKDRQRLVSDLRSVQADTGTSIIKSGEISDMAYFILSGRVVVGLEERILQILNEGDFFGEIAALTGLPRTANVVVDEPVHLLCVPASALKVLSTHPEIQRMLYSTMMERMLSTSLVDIPRAISYDQQTLKQLRTSTSEIWAIPVEA